MCLCVQRTRTPLFSSAVFVLQRGKKKKSLASEPAFRDEFKNHPSIYLSLLLRRTVVMGGGSAFPTEGGRDAECTWRGRPSVTGLMWRGFDASVWLVFISLICSDLPFKQKKTCSQTSGDRLSRCCCNPVAALKSQSEPWLHRFHRVTAQICSKSVCRTANYSK